MPKIAVIIPTIDKTKEYLRNCVESLRATVDWDIIVVSNGTKIKPDYRDIKGITIHLHNRDQGQCGAVNIGARVARPDVDYLFVSNDDMYYAPDWNKNLKFGFLVFSPNLIEPTNNAGSAPPFLKFDGGLTLEGFNRESVDRHIKNIVNTQREENEDGFNLPFFIKKDVWDTIGGYDTKFDPWGSNSDTDLQTKIELAGIKPKRLRDVLVYHFGSKSGTFEPEQQTYWQKNWDYYTEKWGFNRDQLGSDTWYCKDMINYDLLKYKPSWMGKYDKS